MADDIRLWRYHVPSVNGEGWGIFVIGSDGYFSCVTDHGNYAYLWTHHGFDDFRKFLLRAVEDRDYFVTKLGHGKVYDGPETEKALKEAVAENLRDGTWTAEEVEEELELIDRKSVV